MATLGGSANALSSGQTGNGPSTNIAFRGQVGGPGGVTITSTVGATPTVTVDIQGSLDGTTFYNIPYALSGTPATFVVSSLTITTATTSIYLLQADQAWRFLRLNLSANTNVTLSATAYL